MGEVHDLRRPVRADGNGGEVERSEPFADLAEDRRVVPGVPGKVEAPARADDGPAGPEPPVLVGPAAGPPVLGRDAREGEAADLPAFPPVQPVDRGDADGGE